MSTNSFVKALAGIAQLVEYPRNDGYLSQDRIALAISRGEKDANMTSDRTATATRES
jgi:hypothetical protein